MMHKPNKFLTRDILLHAILQISYSEYSIKDNDFH